LKASLAHYYSQVRAERSPRMARLTPYIGKYGSGRSDVSTRTKQLLTESLAAKRAGTGRRA
jgi:hypothetical protein